MHSANQNSATGEEPYLPFTQVQCQQLLAMLSSQASLNPSQPQMSNQITCQNQDASSSTPHQAASAISQFMAGNVLNSHTTLPKHSKARHSVCSTQAQPVYGASSRTSLQSCSTHFTIH